MEYLKEVDLNSSVAEVHDDGPGGPEPSVQRRDTRQHIFVAFLIDLISKPVN